MTMHPRPRTTPPMVTPAQTPQWVIPYPSDGLGYADADEWKRAGRSINGPDTGDRMLAHIARNRPALMRGAKATWKRIQAAVTPARLDGGRVSKELADEVRAAYRDFGSGPLLKAWGAAAIAAGKYMRKQRGYKAGIDEADVSEIVSGWPWEGGIDGLRDWLTQRAGKLITTWGNTELANIRHVLQVVMLESLVTPSKAAQIIRDTGIGLTQPQMDVLDAMRDALIDEGADAALINKRLAWYRKIQTNRRANTIARTELAEAYNRGLFASMDAMRDEGTLEGEPMKRWWTATDERMCDTCGAMHREEAALDDLFSGGYMHPTAHPSCRCTVQYYQEI